MDRDDEANRLSARATRYARLGVNAGALAARVGVNRLRGGGRETDAKALASALGSMKGPMMKVAQMLTTIPDAVPADFAAELMRLQSQAPPMGAAFVRRRMQAELGADWRQRFAEFDLKPAAAASLGQVHERRALRAKRSPASCNIRTWPRRSRPTSRISISCSRCIAAWARRSTRARSRARSASGCARSSTISARPRSPRLYRIMLADRPFVRVPRVEESLSTRRLLTLEWLDGEPLVAFEDAPQEARDAIAVGLFEAWWRPFLRYGVIHGDPHLGNYSVGRPGRAASAASRGSTCSTTAACASSRRGSSRGVVELYRALKANDATRIAEAYAMWGFPKLTRGDDRGDDDLGALHVRPDSRRPRAQRRRRRQAVRIRPARDRRRSCGR